MRRRDVIMILFDRLGSLIRTYLVRKQIVLSFITGQNHSFSLHTSVRGHFWNSQGTRKELFKPSSLICKHTEHPTRLIRYLCVFPRLSVRTISRPIVFCLALSIRSCVSHAPILYLLIFFFAFCALYCNRSWRFLNCIHHIETLQLV